MVKEWIDRAEARKYDFVQIPYSHCKWGLERGLLTFYIHSQSQFIPNIIIYNIFFEIFHLEGALGMEIWLGTFGKHTNIITCKGTYNMTIVRD